MNNPRAYVALGAVIALVVGIGLAWALARAGAQEELPTPSEEDCPDATQIERFTETGDATTEFFDAPTGQFVVSYSFPNGAPGIIYRLSVNPEREGGEVAALGILTDPQDLPENQGQTKVEDVPGRYRLEFSPSDPNQEYVVTVYECDPSGGESTIPPRPSSPPRTTPQPKTSPNLTPPPPPPPPRPGTQPPPPLPPPEPPFKAGGRQMARSRPCPTVRARRSTR